jgi:hypothetical protein
MLKYTGRIFTAAYWHCVTLRRNNDSDLFEMHGYAMNCKWYYNHLTGKFNIRRGSSVAVTQAAKVSFVLQFRAPK